MFVTAIIRLFKEGRVGSITGVRANEMRKGNSTFDNAMYDLGFKKYQLKEDINKWICMSKNNTDGIEVEMSLENLKPGDMLLREDNNGHVEFYLGYKYERDNTKIPFTIKNKTLNDVIQTFTINEKTFQGKEGTFSWGSTHNRLPIPIGNREEDYFYFTFNEENQNKFRLRYSKWSLSYDKNGDYDTVWRYEPCKVK